ncbi:MAG: glycosyltransferase family 4 protein [Chloroflexota bacterium]
MGLRVGLLHYTAPPVAGGVEVVLGQQARLLAEAGHHVRIIVGRGGSTDPRVKVARVPLADTRHPAILAARTSLDGGSVPSTFATLVAALAADLRSSIGDLDVLVAHNVCALHFNLPLTAALHEVTAEPHGPALVAWQHDLAWTSAPYARHLHPGYPWDLLRDPWPRTTYVAVSEARQKEQMRLSGLPLEDVRVVPNGVDVSRLLGLDPSTQRIVEGLGLPGPGPILLVPARITPRKNLEFAIRIVAEVRRLGDDPRLIITGQLDPHDPTANEYFQGLSALATAVGVADVVHFLAVEQGRSTSRRVVTDLYRIADALLLPSHDEGFGLPILEAAVSRLPVICANIASLRELAGLDATYFDPAEDPATVAALIRARLADEPVSRLADRVRREYGWPAIYATRIEPLLREVAGKR